MTDRKQFRLFVEGEGIWGGFLTKRRGTINRGPPQTMFLKGINGPSDISRVLILDFNLTDLKYTEVIARGLVFYIF